jgi:hypothetical protein
MIPRYQRVLFWTLSIAIFLVAAFLLHGCQQAREKLTRRRNSTPLSAPVAAPEETVRMALADDVTGRIRVSERQIALPVELTARAQSILSRLLAEYSYKNSAHPLESGPSVDDVFFIDLPLRAGNPVSANPHESAGGQLAVVNLRRSFAEHHPSGIGVETLTINSIIGTIYANFPRVQAVRFLVEGHTRDTLAGHADLTRTYRVTNTESRSPVPEELQ